VDEKDYRYPGPKPQSRESAIIMLADSVEATSRSLEKPTAAKIRSTVRNVIRTKFGDGQLDECDLTLRNLHKIEETFDRILVNTLHQRVKYPEEGKEDTKEGSEGPVQELAKGTGSSGR
jgi:membrane-associated HD superfamily phosphohydrolase